MQKPFFGYSSEATCSASTNCTIHNCMSNWCVSKKNNPNNEMCLIAIFGVSPDKYVKYPITKDKPTYQCRCVENKCKWK